MAPPASIQFEIAQEQTPPSVLSGGNAASAASLDDAQPFWPAEHLPRPAQPVVAIAANMPQGSLVRSLVQGARRQGWRVATDMLHTGVYPHGCRADGLIAISNSIATPTFTPLPADIPRVTIALSIEDAPGASVTPDNFAIGELAAYHLYARGHRTFLCAPYVENCETRQRVSGFEYRLQKLGLFCERLPPLYEHTGLAWTVNFEAWRSALAASMQNGPSQLAVFATSDCVAERIAEFCEDANRCVPGEVEIVGVGDFAADCEPSYLPISSVALDLETMIQRATESMSRILRGEPGRDFVVPPKGVVERAGATELPGQNPRVSQAIAIIDERFPDPNFGVGEVADEIAVSRRQLERDFRAATGCTIREYIEDTRMNEASRLLRTHPRAKVSEIAKLVGITSSGGFFRVFRRRFGLTPTAYREQELAALEFPL